MDAKEWLENRLTLYGRKMAGDIEAVQNDARKAGFTKREMKEARRALGVKLVRAEDDGETVQWVLP